MWNRNNQRGFTLVETMVSMALLSTVIYLAMSFMNDQKKSRTDRSKQSIQRYIAVQTSQHITSNISFYPPIQTQSLSKKIIYYGCLDKNGVLLGTTTYKFKEVPVFYTASNCTDPSVKSLTHYEVDFFWSPRLLTALNISPPDKVTINIKTKYFGQNKSISSRNFEIFAK